MFLYLEGFISNKKHLESWKKFIIAESWEEVCTLLLIYLLLILIQRRIFPVFHIIMP